MTYGPIPFSQQPRYVRDPGSIPRRDEYARRYHLDGEEELWSEMARRSGSLPEGAKKYWKMTASGNIVRRKGRSRRAGRVSTHAGESRRSLRAVGYTRAQIRAIRRAKRGTRSWSPAEPRAARSSNRRSSKRGRSIRAALRAAGYTRSQIRAVRRSGSGVW